MLEYLDGSGAQIERLSHRTTDDPAASEVVGN